MTEGTVDRRTLIGGFVTAIATSGLAGAACAQSAPKTFVLVHGAFLGGWCWRRVSDRLAESGHKVFSLTLSGLGCLFILNEARMKTRRPASLRAES